MSSPKLSDEVIVAGRQELHARMEIVAGAVAYFNPSFAIAIPIASFIFAADLLRDSRLNHLPLYFLNVLTRKEDDAPTEWRVRVPRSLPDLYKKRILLIDSCLDSGRTLLRTKQFLLDAAPEAVMSVVAIDKAQPNCLTKVAASLFKMNGLSNPHIFGYGLDDEDGSKRGLPYVAYKRVKKE